MKYSWNNSFTIDVLNFKIISIFFSPYAYSFFILEAKTDSIQTNSRGWKNGKGFVVSEKHLWVSICRRRGGEQMFPPSPINREGNTGGILSFQTVNRSSKSAHFSVLINCGFESSMSGSLGFPKRKSGSIYFFWSNC